MTIEGPQVPTSSALYQCGAFRLLFLERFGPRNAGPWEATAAPNAGTLTAGRSPLYIYTMFGLEEATAECLPRIVVSAGQTVSGQRIVTGAVATAHVGYPHGVAPGYDRLELDMMAEVISASMGEADLLAEIVRQTLVMSYQPITQALKLLDLRPVTKSTPGPDGRGQWRAPVQWRIFMEETWRTTQIAPVLEGFDVSIAGFDPAAGLDLRQMQLRG